MPKPEIAITATALLVKAAVLSAKWAGAARRCGLERIADGDRDAEILFLRERVAQLQLQVSILRKHLGKHAKSPRYSLAERLHVLWFLEYFQIPRRQVPLSGANGTTHPTGMAAILSAQILAQPEARRP